MSSTISDLKTRRSIRKYQQKSVPNQEIKEILETASWAPSAHNAQPWRFMVLTEESSKRELSSAMAKAWVVDVTKDGQKIDDAIFLAKVERFANAPVLILACLTMDDMHKQPDQARQNTEHDLALESLGTAMQNLLVAAHTKGLGACWYCAPAFCKETVRALLKIPPEVEPAALVAMGYPNEKPPVPQRKSLDEFCFKESWGIRF
jgi:coenzyme F420-0:L-glutamate ligase / coenzyme F420-1:gamma-L-glutamate ligase